MKSLLSFVRNYRTSPKAHLVLSQKQVDILIGTMLGDAHAERKTPRNNTRITIHQTSKHWFYVKHLYELFGEFTGSMPIALSSYHEARQQTYNSMKFSTLSLPCFNQIHDMFYDANKLKVLPANLESILTAEGIAYWFMDDGYKHDYQLAFCTESFSQSENETLKGIFENKFGIKCSVRPTTNGPRLYILGDSKAKFTALVKPYMLTEFLYKLGDK